MSHFKELSDSSIPQSILVDDYKLALKLFMNKDFAKSYELTQKLQSVSFRSLQRGDLDDELFIKIFALYLTLVGLLINPAGLTGSFQIPRPEKKELLSKIQKGSFLQDLEEIYGNTSQIPTELLYQIGLVGFSCRNELNKENNRFLLEQFDTLYSEINFNKDPEDRYMKRLAEMYVFNVLPEFEEFKKAHSILHANPLLDNERGSKKLSEIEEMKKQEKKAKDRNEKERSQREQKRMEQLNEKKNEAKEKANLKYKSLKQIKQTHEYERSSNTPEPHSDKNLSLEAIKERLLLIANLTRGYIKQNSPVIVVTAVILIIAAKFFKSRKINAMERVQDLMKMAFKITYL